MTVSSSTGYRPEIDGLRAIAVVAVILFHAGAEAVSGGFVGVDIFFVISGFLITSHILEDQSRGRFTLTGFYARRARRILPALFFVVVACIPAAAVLMSPPEILDFARMLTSVALFGSNFFLASTAGYFDTAAELKPLLHTWSLAVEEQYYLLFPAVMLALGSIRRRWLVLWLSAAAVGSLAASEYGSLHYQAVNFFLTTSRIWELLVGALAAIAALQAARREHTGPTMLHHALAWLGLLSVVGPLFLFGSFTPAPSAIMLIPTVGTALVLLYGRPGTSVALLLSWSPLVAIGLVSYSAYLWHQPLLAFARINHLGPLSLAYAAGVVVATGVLAFLTWKYVEQPARKRTTLSHALTLRLALIGTVVLALVGWAGQHIAVRLPPTVAPSVLKAFEPTPRAAECFDVPFGHEIDVGWTCPINPGTEPSVSFIVFGDSHALQVLGALSVAAQASGRTGEFAGFSGCAPLLGIYPLGRPDQARRDCHALNNRMLAHAKAMHIKDIVLVARWSYYVSHGYSKGYLNAIGLQAGDTATVEISRVAFKQGLLNTVEAYANAGVRVHVLEQVPQQLFAPRAQYESARRSFGSTNQNLLSSSVPLALHQALQSFPNSVIRDVEKTGKLKAWNFDDVLCASTVCPVGTEDMSYYQDESHLSEDGARRLVPAFIRLLTRM